MFRILNFLFLIYYKDAQARLDGFIDLALSHKIPVSSFHFGSGYSSRGKRRYVFTWNKEKFPDPRVLMRKFAEHRIKVVANIKPCLLTDHPAYDQLRLTEGFIRSSTSHEPIIEPFWDGVLSPSLSTLFVPSFFCYNLY